MTCVKNICSILTHHWLLGGGCGKRPEVRLALMESVSDILEWGMGEPKDMVAEQNVQHGQASIATCKMDDRLQTLNGSQPLFIFCRSEKGAWGWPRSAESFIRIGF
jgi:hypothetical protein